MQNEFKLTDRMGRQWTVTIYHELRWTKCCHGDQYTHVTTCNIKKGYKTEHVSSVRRHRLDDHDPSFAAKAAFTKALSKALLKKEYRRILWRDVLLKYPPKNT